MLSIDEIEGYCYFKCNGYTYKTTIFAGLFLCLETGMMISYYNIYGEVMMNPRKFSLI